jgi:serine O-acetyltransferase
LSCVHAGADTDDGFLGSLLSALAKSAPGQIVPVDSTPHAMRDYVHVDDVVAALVAIATRGTQPLYNVAGGNNVDNAQLFARLGELSGRDLRARRATVSRHRRSSRSSGCAREFGWQPTPLMDHLPALPCGRLSRADPEPRQPRDAARLRVPAARQPLSRRSASGRRPALQSALPTALQRLGRCIDAVRWWPQGTFDHLHSSQYTTFLYFLANTLWRAAARRAVLQQLFGLNKALNGIDLFYEIEMPEVFFIGHSVGIVLAKARYGNRLVSLPEQHRRQEPRRGAVARRRHRAVPEQRHHRPLRDRRRIGRLPQGVSVINRDTPGGSMVFQGSAGELVFKPSTRDVLADIFR